MMSRVTLSLAFIFAGSANAQSGHDTCVDVQVGTAQSYACINQKLAAQAREAQKSAPGGGVPPANQTGQFNEDATRNRLGANFGKSVTPARPPVQTTPPVRAGAA
jgi:hypothetical protein